MSIHPGERQARACAIALACIVSGLAGGAAAQAESVKPFAIKTADGVVLTGPDGAPARAAIDLGLANIIGWGAVDVAGLTGILGRGNLADAQRDVTLTLDSRAQKIVQETLAHHLTRIVDDKEKPRRFFADRRAAIVLMDADTGALVAVGSWPPPPANAGPAELERLAREPQREDPLSIPAWRPPAKNDAASSSLTPLVALAAAIEASDPAAKADDRIAAMLLGMDRATYRRRLGVDAAASRLPIVGSPHSIETLGGATPRIGGTLRGPSCVDGAVPTADKLNVGIALKSATNTYFGRLALLLEERAIEAWAKALPKDRRGALDVRVISYPRTRLAARLAQFGMDGTIDLAANAGLSPLARLRGEAMLDRLFVPPMASTLPPRSSLPGDPTLQQHRGEYQYHAALAGTGDASSVTPVHLAMGAAAIARGEGVRPFLLAALGGTKLSPPPPEKFTVRADLMDAIRAGMKAVTEAEWGSLSGVYAAEPRFILGEEYAKLGDGPIGKRVTAVRQARQGADPKAMWCRVSARSGTSDSAISGVNAGWAMGWKEPLVAGGRRLAFACMVTHLDFAYGGPRFGGAVCGAIMRDIQFSLEVMDPPDFRAN